MTIRAGREEDVAAVLALERAVAEAPHWAEAEYWGALSAAREGGVRRCLMVAEVDGRVKGFAVGKMMDLGAGSMVGELESVVVAGDERRKGLGRALCGAVVEWCGSQGAEAMELEVRAGGVAAIGLYEGMGFAGVGRRPEYYFGPVEDALLMRMDLAG